MRASASSLPALPSPSLPLAADEPSAISSTTSANPLAGVPELSSYVSSDAEEKTRALKLVADSVAQMRQTASRILIFHPMNMAVFFAFLAVVGNYLYNSRTGSIGLVFTTTAGLVTAGLVGIRWVTNPYIEAAEAITVNMLEGADVLVTKFGDEVIGTVIVGWEAAESRGKRRKWRAEIKGWAVRIRYRGKGVGAALLEDAVALAKSKGAENIEFAEDHASKFLVVERRVTYEVELLTFRQTQHASSTAFTTPPSTARRSWLGISYSHFGKRSPRARRSHSDDPAEYRDILITIDRQGAWNIPLITNIIYPYKIFTLQLGWPSLVNRWSAVGQLPLPRRPQTLKTT